MARGSRSRGAYRTWTCRRRKARSPPPLARSPSWATIRAAPAHRRSRRGSTSRAPCHRCPDVPPRRATCLRTTKKAVGTVTLSEDGFAGPACDQSDPARQIRQDFVPEFVERRKRVDHLRGFDTPRRLESEPDATPEPRVVGRRSDEGDQPRMAGPATNSASSRRRSRDPGPPFHRPETSPPKIASQKKTATHTEKS